jgi:hypothetical protein
MVDKVYKEEKEEKPDKDIGWIKAISSEYRDQVKAKKELLEIEEKLKEKGYEINFIQSEIVDQVKELTKKIHGSSEKSGQINKSFRDMSRITRDVASNWMDIYDGSVKEADIAKQITKAKKAGNKVSLETNNLLVKGGVSQDKIKQLYKDGNLELNAQKMSKLKLTKHEKELLLASIKTLKTNKENLKILEAQEKKLKEANTGLVKGLNAAADVMGKIGLGEFSAPMKEGAEAARMAALEGKGFSGQMAAAGGAIKAMMGPLIAIGVIMAGFKFDKQITNLQKGMGISKNEAFGLKMEMAEAAAASDDMAINSERLLKTFSMLQSQLGIAANFSTEMTEDATVLSEKLGLSEKATANFAQSSLVVGKSIDEQYKSSLGIINSIQVQTGAMIPFKETLEKAGNITGQIRAQMGGSLEEITKAVGVAASLGMELEQVAKSGESMLNFQSSIESELEAELLTGKQLNLEKARLLALTGDYEGLAKEISKEAGNFTEFSKMNVLQQNALAKSLGMSSNEMSDMLMKEEMIGQTKESALAAGNEDLAKRIEARDVQEQMADAVAKLKGVFVDLVGGPVGSFLNLLTLCLTPIGIMMEGLSKILGLFGESEKPMTKMEAVLGSIAAIYLGIKATQIASNTLAGIKYAWAMRHKSALVANNILERKGLGSTVARAAGSIFRQMSSLGPLGIGLAIAAIAGMASLVYGLSNRKAEKGGMIGGNRHSSGGTIIEAEQGEFIMSRSGVQSVGVDNLYAMNRGGGISGGKAQAGGVVQSTSGQSNSGMNMQSFTDAVISAVNNTKPGVVIASPYGLNNTNYQSRNENFKTKFE